MTVLIWGIGRTAKLAVKNGIKGELVGFIDNSPIHKTFAGKPVYAPDSIEPEYDYIYVVSKESGNVLREIKKWNISIDKVCFKHLPQTTEINCEKNLDCGKKFLLEGNLTRVEGYSESKYSFIWHDLDLYNRMNARETFKYNEKLKRFICADKYSDAGALGSYFFQDLWAAKLIFINSPAVHYDIGSRVDGFIAHLLSFRDNVTMIDIRPMKEKIPGVNFLQADATNLDPVEDDSIESLSALSSLEHFGLGRYGDPIDPESCFRAFKAIPRKMKPGGNIYISVPIGKEHIEFNAHRIFSPRTIVESFDKMYLLEFSATDGVSIMENPPLNLYDHFDNIGGEIFGLFCFQKK